MLCLSKQGFFSTCFGERCRPVNAAVQENEQQAKSKECKTMEGINKNKKYAAFVEEEGKTGILTRRDVSV